MKQKHDGKHKDFKCIYCNSKFSSKDLLFAHMKSEHEGKYQHSDEKSENDLQVSSDTDKKANEIEKCCERHIKYMQHEIYDEVGDEEARLKRFL